MTIAAFRQRDGVKEYMDRKNDDGKRGGVKASAASTWLLEEILVRSFNDFQSSHTSRMEEELVTNFSQT